MDYFKASQLKDYFINKKSTLSSIVEITKLYREGIFTQKDVYEIFLHWGIKIEKE